MALPLMRRIFLRGRTTILTLHRFAHAEGDTNALGGRQLDLALYRFRKLGFHFVTLLDIVEAMEGNSRLPRNAIAFTVDDGYFDFAEVAAPIFAKHKCPVTVFLITGFLDGVLWPWWDQVEFLLKRIPDAELSKHNIDGRFNDRLKASSTREMLQSIADLAIMTGFEIPKDAPSRYRPMTWNQVRLCARNQVHFAPHSTTHPILSRASDGQSRQEIVESWKRVRDECVSAAPLFAFPNGQPGDYSRREIDFLRQAGIKGAVTTSPGHVQTTRGPATVYELPRWDLSSDRVHMSQVLNGFEDAKGGIRRLLRNGA